MNKKHILSDKSILEIKISIDQIPIDPSNTTDFPAKREVISSSVWNVLYGRATRDDAREFIENHGPNPIGIRINTHGRERYALIASWRDVLKYTGLKTKREAYLALKCIAREHQAYFNGECYQYVILHDGEIIDSCSGFYSEEHCMEDAMENFKRQIKNEEAKIKECEKVVAI